MAAIQPIAIAGIHTDIGKTIVAAILTEALQADYWKPVQAGAPDQTDLMTVQQLVSNPVSRCHPEAIRLKLAASPHHAAACENKTYDCREFQFPLTDNLLLVETAGGLMSPVDARHTVADFIQYHQMPAILVTRHYLGSINHTLLCLELMKQRGIPLLCLVVNGPRDEASEAFIVPYAGSSPVIYTEQLNELTPEQISLAAQWLKAVSPLSFLYEQYQPKG
ncbi:dethiobiotin synthase [Taibaiella koreensis]|uniref:dethiobiotin synthase n=1 Tax=Taibaiella koreensis TaxID=1268548 RepID=UPI0019695EDD|nr:dethiobiotin synthase [Taibaiella koreensis]